MSFVPKKINMDDFSVKVLIVEDDFSFALELQMLLEELGYYVAGKIDNGIDAFKLIQKDAPDLILMDIELKGNLDGIEIAKKIKHLPIPILFITSRVDEPSYQKANESNMIGYLTKPIGKFSLRSSILMAISNAHNLLKKQSKQDELHTADHIITKHSFFFKNDDIYKKVLTRDIAYISSERNYCDICTQTGSKFVARITISNLASMLPDYFMKIHRQYIVNLKSVKEVYPKKDMLIIGNAQIPISRPNKKELFQRLNIIP